MNEIKITFEVKKIIYYNENTGFTIASVKIKRYPRGVEIPTAETVIKGNFYAIYVNDEFEAYGNWIDTGRNGYQFNIIKAKLIFPETSKGMVSFIQKYVKGVGKKTATKIVETFQENTMQVIRNGWEEIAKIDGISEKKAKRIHDSISIQRDFEEVLCFLLEYGVSYMNSIEIYEIFGYGAIEKIREYTL